MPDFHARMTAGVVPAVWSDHEPEGGASRLNTAVAHPPKYLRGRRGVAIEVRLTVAGAEGPDDSALGGRLFTSDFAEAPTAFPPATYAPPGQSSVISFTPFEAGHYLWMIRRPGGGAIGLHFDVEA